jgi:hypothetical protein
MAQPSATMSSTASATRENLRRWPDGATKAIGLAVSARRRTLDNDAAVEFGQATKFLYPNATVDDRLHRDTVQKLCDENVTEQLCVGKDRRDTT